MALVFGRVPHPVYLDRPIEKPENWGQNDLGRRSVKGVVWHRMIGSLWGTDTYFRRSDVKALTDYGVGVLAQDGATSDGTIIRWNDPLGVQSGWASGTYSSAAYGDGAAFVAKYGIDAINRDQASIEISGLTYDVPLSPRSRDAIAALTAYWADQYEIPWDVFPIAPQDGFSFVRWHNEFGPDNGLKKCPGQIVMQETPALIERVRAILKEHQTSGVKAPEYAEPLALPFTLGEDTGWHTFTKTVDAYLFEAEVEALKPVVRHAYAEQKSPQSGPKIPTRTKVTVYAWFEGDDGAQWYLLKDRSRVRAAHFTPSITIRKR